MKVSSFKKGVAVSLVFLLVISSCTSIPQAPWPQKQGYVGGRYVGIGYARIKGKDLARARQEALIDAFKNLASANDVVVRSFISDYIRSHHGVSEENLESYVSLSFFNVLGKKHIEDEIDPDGHYWVRVSITDRDFRDGIKATIALRAREFKRAWEYYKTGKSVSPRQAHDALNWHEKSKKLLEEIQATSDYHTNKQDTTVLLYSQVERAIFSTKRRIAQAEKEYRKAEVAINRHRLKSAELHLKKAFEMVEDNQRFEKLSAQLEDERQHFKLLMQQGDDLFAQGNYSHAKMFYQKALSVDSEEDVKEQVKDTESRIQASNKKLTNTVSAILLVVAMIAVPILWIWWEGQQNEVPKGAYCCRNGESYP